MTYTFQSESTIYSCLNVNELLARNRRYIWSLSDNNGIRTHNHLVRKRIHNHLGKHASLSKWLSVCLRTKWLWVRIPLLLLFYLKVAEVNRGYLVCIESSLYWFIIELHWDINPLGANPTKWSNTLKQFVDKLPTNCLSVFDHFVKLAPKGLTVLFDVWRYQFERRTYSFAFW